MVIDPTPYPTLDRILKTCLKTKRFKIALEAFFENIYESAKDGNQSWTRQKCYIGLQRDLPMIEREFIEVFNKLTYRKRRTLDT